MRRATHTPTTGNGSDARSAIVVGRLCQTPAQHQNVRLTIPRFQLAFGHTGVHALDVMKTQFLMIAAVGLLMAACNRQAPTPKTPKTDLDRFQGTWYLVMAMQDGKALDQDKVKQTTIVFKGDT